MEIKSKGAFPEDTGSSFHDFPKRMIRFLIQIVPWNRADESLCRIGLRNTQHLFLPTVKKSFLRSREDFTDTTLTTTNGDRSILSEVWRNLKTE